MPILSIIGRKRLRHRLVVVFLYATLTLLGISMVVPFLITLTNSAANSFDYNRFSILPRSLWSKEDRFVKGTVLFFNRYQAWFNVFQASFTGVPESWTSWRAIGRDTAASDAFATHYLHPSAEAWRQWKRQAADYAEYSMTYPIGDTLAIFSDEQAAKFIGLTYERAWVEQNPEKASQAGSSEREKAGLALLSQRWGLPISSFLSIKFDGEIRAPLGQQSWVAPATPKQADFLLAKRAVRFGLATPGVLPRWIAFLRSRGHSASNAKALAPVPVDASSEVLQLWLEFSRDNAPASPVIPFPLRLVWLEYLGSDAVRALIGISETERFDVVHYNRLAGSNYNSLRETPFPLPADFTALRPLWERFITERYPLRLLRLEVNPGLEARYRRFLQSYSSLSNVNALMGTTYGDWNEFKLSPAIPAAPGVRDVWCSFVKQLPADLRHTTSSEAMYQDFLSQKYGSLDKINAAYGWHLQRIEEAFPPLDKAYAVTFQANSTAFAWQPLLSNYGTMVDFLVSRGNAIPVTIWLIGLSIFVTLTVNPAAGYALSRFHLNGKDKIILFCLATSAFPAMVSAIPGYLLMRDLGLLNTFFALVLPGAASGMSIFILKGFFDSLPQELYEAATIDGAKEWQIFGFVTVPMVKPILAINALNAFLAAYGGWEWALIICQDPRMWTLSVWLYQANEWWAQTPWITTAGFILASIPTLVVFLFCQDIIMRGIIVPSMK